MQGLFDDHSDSGSTEGIGEWSRSLGAGGLGFLHVHWWYM